MSEKNETVAELFERLQLKIDQEGFERAEKLIREVSSVRTAEGRPVRSKLEIRVANVTLTLVIDFEKLTVQVRSK